MNWLLFAQLVVQEGFPFASALWKLMQSLGTPTAAQLAELDALSKNSANSKLSDAMMRAGIDLSSPPAVALLALTQTP